MLTQEFWMNIKALSHEGHSIRAIARMTGLSRTTVRKILSEPVPKGYGPRPPKAKKLDEYEPYLETALGARPWACASKLHREIMARGFDGNYELVKRWVRQRRQEAQVKRRACVRFETEPGVEGQFDWKGPIKGLLVGEPERAVWIFRFVLGYSRFRLTRAVLGMKLPAVLTDLMWVFEKLGGVPDRFVFDNFKAAVQVPRPHLRLHPVFADFCAHYGIEPAPALPRAPERKGKTERSFLDLEQTELLRQSYGSLAALQLALELDDLRHSQQVVSTTGQRPDDRLVRERPFLHPLPATRFDPRPVESRQVLSDCTIAYRGAFYSVPARLVGERVLVKADPNGTHFEVVHLTQSLGAYPIQPKGTRFIVEDHVRQLQRTRFDRLRPPTPAAPPEPILVPPTLSVVPWPLIDVVQRPIADYLAALEVQS